MQPHPRGDTLSVDKGTSWWVVFPDTHQVQCQSLAGPSATLVGEPQVSFPAPRLLGLFETVADTPRDGPPQVAMAEPKGTICWRESRGGLDCLHDQRPLLRLSTVCAPWPGHRSRWLKTGQWVVGVGPALSGFDRYLQTLVSPDTIRMLR